MSDVGIIPREDWGAKYRDGVGYRAVDDLYVYAHHTVTAQLPESASLPEDTTQIRTVESIGQQRFGAGMSYTLLIMPSGRVFEGVSINRISYHSGGWRNTSGAAICFVGNYQTHKLGQPAMDSAAWLLRKGLANKWWTPEEITQGHRDFKSTACPGRNVYNLIDAMNELARGIDLDVPDKPDRPDEQDEWPYVALWEDGDFGPLTKKALQRLLIGIDLYDGTIRAAGLNKAAVRGLQSWLYRLGPYRGFNIDGKWGYYTTRALQDFLATKPDGRGRYTGLRDGDFGPWTVESLQEYLNYQRGFFQ